MIAETQKAQQPKAAPGYYPRRANDNVYPSRDARGYQYDERDAPAYDETAQYDERDAPAYDETAQYDERDAPAYDETARYDERDAGGDGGEGERDASGETEVDAAA